MAISQKQLILRHLKVKGSITPIEALNLYGCFRLSARIQDLRKANHPISTKMISDRNKRFAQYFYDGKTIRTQQAKSILLGNANNFYYFIVNDGGQSSAIQLTVDNFEDHYPDFIAQKYRAIISSGNIERKYLKIVKEQAKDYLECEKYFLVTQMLIEKLDEIINGRGWNMFKKRKKNGKKS